MTSLFAQTPGQQEWSQASRMVAGVGMSRESQGSTDQVQSVLTKHRLCSAADSGCFLSFSRISLVGEISLTFHRAKLEPGTKPECLAQTRLPMPPTLPSGQPCALKIHRSENSESNFSCVRHSHGPSAPGGRALPSSFIT